MKNGLGLLGEFVFLESVPLPVKQKSREIWYSFGIQNCYNKYVGLPL
jgi:hypothetical protein